MPKRIYDFECQKCQHQSEHWVDIEVEEDPMLCDKCEGGHLVRCFPTPSFKMPRESQFGYDGNGAKVKFGEAGRYNPKTGKIDT